MALTERKAAAREATSAIAMVERPSQRRRNGPRPRADFGDAAIRRVPHHHPTRVACQALRRLRGNARAALEHGVARRIGIREHLGVDVDDHLVSLARGAGIDAVVQRRLGDEGQRVRLLLLDGGCFRATVGCTPGVRQRN